MVETTFPTYAGPLPVVDTPAMIEVDRAMIEDYRIELIQMMENAGRNLAHLTRARFLDGDPRGKLIVVLAGSGGNGGGALVTARRLSCWGADVVVVLGQSKDQMTTVPRHQLDIIERMGVTVWNASRLAQHRLNAAAVLDGLIGYSLSGDPRDDPARLINWANQQGGPIISLDVPSGYDAANGVIRDPAIRATATLTLALPKPSLQAPDARDTVGELYLADISVPPGLYAHPPLHLSVEPIFAQSDIVRIV
ncbi:MAG: NAD(P)H-hydrate epimerase [Geminicoccales bacterium]